MPVVPYNISINTLGLSIIYIIFYTKLTVRGLRPRDGVLDPGLHLRHPGVHPGVVRVPTASPETRQTHYGVSETLIKSTS